MGDPAGIILIAVVGGCVIWLGAAWGLDAVRRPRDRWHKGMRWTWIVALGIVLGIALILVAGLFADWYQAVDRRANFWNQLLPRLGYLSAGFVVLAVIPGACVAYLTRLVARASGIWCNTCGYDLRGTHSDRCPECGTPVSARESRGVATDLGRLRRRTFYWIRTAVLGVGALVLLAIAGFVAVDYFALPGVPANAVWCRRCGATELCYRSRCLGLPQLSVECFHFQGSPSCAHEWAPTTVTRASRPALLLDPAAGDVVVFRASNGDGANQPIYGALEVGEWGDGAKAGDSAFDFVIRWRSGQGSLTADDAQLARIVLVSTPHIDDSGKVQYEVPYLDSCEPPSAAGAVQRLLNLTARDQKDRVSLAAKFPLAFGLPTQGRTVPTILATEAHSFPTSIIVGPTGGIVGITADPPSPQAVALAGFTGKEWNAIRDRKTLWQEIVLRANGWDGYTAIAYPNEK